jgi:spermidine synthase
MAVKSIEVSEKQGVRYLHFGSAWVQGAMRIARPWSLELEYTRELMMPLLFRPSETWPASALQVGLGSASITRFLYRHRPRTRITVVELEPAVVAAARHFFKLPDDDERLRIEIGDAYEYVAANRRRFDLVQVDGFDAAGRAGMLDTVPFYLNCRDRLVDGGMMAVNFLTSRRGLAGSIARLREVFGEGVAVLAPCAAGNTVALAARRPIALSPEDLAEPARRLKEATGLDLFPTLARLA